jgi:aspartate aminotransferase
MGDSLPVARIIAPAFRGWCMTGFSQRVEQVSISGIREVFEAAGEDAINLGLGQPDFPAPEHAREAAVEAIRAGEADAYTSN